MRAASEHPRLAAALAAGLIVLALAGVVAGRALGGGSPIRTGDGVLRVAVMQLARLRLQLHASEAQRAQLRGRVITLTAELAHARESQRRPGPATRSRRARPNR